MSLIKMRMMFFINKKKWIKLEKKLKNFGSTDQQGVIRFIRSFAVDFIFKILNQIVVFLLSIRALVILTILLTVGSLAIIIVIALIVKLLIVLVLVKFVLVLGRLTVILIDELNYLNSCSPKWYFVFFTIVFVCLVVL